MLTSGGHDGELGPSRLQSTQPKLISGFDAMDASSKDVQLHVAVLAQEFHQVIGTVWAGAPGDETGDSVLLLLVQVPGTDLIQEAQLCMAWLERVSTLGTEEGEEGSGTCCEQGRAGPRGWGR